MTTSLEVFLRQVRSRSKEHGRAMNLLASERLAGQMVSVLRQELDSMVRVIFLLSQCLPRRNSLIEASVKGERWTRDESHSPVTDREMVELADKLQGWTKSVYKFGCAFIHLSNLHDYNDRDPLLALPPNERAGLLDHCRRYHGGPPTQSESFDDLVDYIPMVFKKISDNLEHYLQCLESSEVPNLLHL